MAETKKILVTGGLGFIGSNVIRHLLSSTDYSFIVLDKYSYAGHPSNLPADRHLMKRINLVKGDILKKRDVESVVKDSNYILHMAANTNAATSLSHVLPTIQTNVIGTTLLLEAAKKYSIERFIQFSSSEVYGNQQEGILMDENHPLNPVTPYAASKLAADRLAYSFYLSKQLPVVIIRLFNAYGPYQHPEKMVPLFITRLLSGQKIFLNNGGIQTRDFVHVTDHARAIELLLKANSSLVEGEVFNIGTGKTSRIIDVAKKICRTLKKKPKEWIAINEGKTTETKGNVGVSTKIYKSLRWKPITPINDGLEQTVEWYINNQSWWKRAL